MQKFLVLLFLCFWFYGCASPPPPPAPSPLPEPVAPPAQQLSLEKLHLEVPSSDPLTADRYGAFAPDLYLYNGSENFVKDVEVRVLLNNNQERVLTAFVGDDAAKLFDSPSIIAPKKTVEIRPFEGTPYKRRDILDITMHSATGWDTPTVSKYNQEYEEWSRETEKRLQEWQAEYSEWESRYGER